MKLDRNIIWINEKNEKIEKIEIKNLKTKHIYNIVNMLERKILTPYGKKMLKMLKLEINIEN